MIVRPCSRDDIPDLVAMGRQFYAASGLPGDYSADRSRELCENLINSELGIALRSDRGMILGVLAPAYCADLLMAVEIAWWAKDGHGLTLLHEFEDRAKALGAQHIRFSTLPAMGERASGLLGRFGYAPIEISHGKDI